MEHFRETLDHDLYTGMGDPLGVFFVFKAEVAAACRDDQGARQLGQHLIRRVAGRTVGVCHRFAVVREVEAEKASSRSRGRTRIRESFL